VCVGCVCVVCVSVCCVCVLPVCVCVCRVCECRVCVSCVFVFVVCVAVVCVCLCCPAIFFKFKGALQLLSKRHTQIRFAHVDERVLELRSFHQRFTHETRKNSEQAIDESKLKLSFIMSRSTKVMSTR